MPCCLRLLAIRVAPSTSLMVSSAPLAARLCIEGYLMHEDSQHTPKPQQHSRGANLSACFADVLCACLGRPLDDILRVSRLVPTRFPPSSQEQQTPMPSVALLQPRKTHRVAAA